MTDVNALNGYTQTGTSTTNTASQNLSADMNTFLTLLTTQLKYQDPLDPMDTAEFTNQLVQYSSVEQAIQTNEKLDSLLSMNIANLGAQAVSYIGKVAQVLGNVMPLEGGKAKATYTLDKNVVSTTIVVKDMNGNIVYSEQGKVTSGTHEFTWDGKDSNGNQLEDGAYQIIVNPKVASGEAQATVTTTIFGKVTGVASDENGIYIQENGNYKFADINGYTISYENGKPVAIDTVVLSTQHHPRMSDGNKMKPEFIEAVIEHIIKPVLPQEWLKNTRFLINPTGRFVVGGPQGDCGLTGRKIIVDTYGGACPHGGGAFSGKDPSKVDRSAAYACRYVAKNIVAAGLASRCQVQVSYAIGVAQPINVTVRTFGTGKIADDKIAELVRRHFDLRPRGIIQMLDLLRPISSKTAAYGHFGREEPEFTWERTDKAELLKADAF